MKYLVLIGDGMSDYPLKELGGKTPLEAAKTPNMDFLAQNGVCGWVNNVPKNLPPASDVAAMSIFGYDPTKYYTGRGPLEAASLGVKLKSDEIAFRCNLVSVKDGKMESFTAHQIKTDEAHRLIDELNNGLGSKDIRFVAGLSYRHLLIIKSRDAKLAATKCTPPHDITDRTIQKYLPKSELLLQLMNESEVILHGLKTKATMIWPWSQGRVSRMPSFKSKYGEKGAVITAVDLLKGLGKILGMTVINVPGATGYLDTNYKGKAEYALKALKDHGVVFVHVEAPDEAGHEGSVKNKIRAIEDFDRLVVGTVLKGVRALGGEGVRMLVLPDHPTPISLMTHSRDEVPFVIWGPSTPPRLTSFARCRSGQEGIRGYNEKEIKKSNFRVKLGDKLLALLFK